MNQKIKTILGVPENSDKWEFRIQQYSFEDIENVVDQILSPIVEVLTDIAEPKGAYSRDALTHANNTIFYCKEKATRVLNDITGKPDVLKLNARAMGEDMIRDILITDEHLSQKRAINLAIYIVKCMMTVDPQERGKYQAVMQYLTVKYARL